MIVEGAKQSTFGLFTTSLDGSDRGVSNLSVPEGDKERTSDERKQLSFDLIEMVGYVTLIA